MVNVERLSDQYIEPSDLLPREPVASSAHETVTATELLQLTKRLDMTGLDETESNRAAMTAGVGG